MPSFDDNRVLLRRGARKLTAQETEHVAAAAAFNTLVCTAIVQATSTTTGPGDGDGCSDHDSDHS